MTHLSWLERAARKPRCPRAAATAIAFVIFSVVPGAAPAWAAPLFAAPFLTFDAGANPTSVAVGDLNGDGMPDLVTANDLGSSGVGAVRRTARANRGGAVPDWCSTAIERRACLVT